MVITRKRTYTTQTDRNGHENNIHRRRRLFDTNHTTSQLNSSGSELIVDSTDIEHDETQGLPEFETTDINSHSSSEEEEEEEEDNRLDLYLSDVHLASESGSVDGGWRWWILTSVSTEDNKNQNENNFQWIGKTRSEPLSDEEYNQMAASSVDKPMVIRFRFGTDLQTVGMFINLP
jgi:hypothetical protein